MCHSFQQSQKYDLTDDFMGALKPTQYKQISSTQPAYALELID